jgi:fructokinase
VTDPVVVAGESLVDLILDTQGGLRAAVGGGPYNTARTIGKLGGRVAFLGCVSRDRFGEQSFQALVDDEVETTLTVRTESPSTLAMAELDAHNAASYRFYVDGTAAPELSTAMALRALEQAPWALHLGTLGLVFEPIATSLETLVESLPPETWLMLDPNARPSATPDLGAWRSRIARITARASIVRVTTDDLAVLAPGADPQRAARAMLGQGPAVVVLTDGPHAVHILARDRATTTLPVPSVDVIDTVGSGDAFGGALVAWWQAHGLGRDDFDDPAAVESATRSAIRVASVTCTRPGADPPTLAELGGWD